MRCTRQAKGKRLKVKEENPPKAFWYCLKPQASGLKPRIFHLGGNPCALAQRKNGSFPNWTPSGECFDSQMEAILENESINVAERALEVDNEGFSEVWLDIRIFI